MRYFKLTAKSDGSESFIKVAKDGAPGDAGYPEDRYDIEELPRERKDGEIWDGQKFVRDKNVDNKRREDGALALMSRAEFMEEVLRRVTALVDERLASTNAP